EGDPALARGRQRSVTGQGVAGRDLAQQPVARPPANSQRRCPRSVRPARASSTFEGPSVSVADREPTGPAWKADRARPRRLRLWNSPAERRATGRRDSPGPFSPAAP